MTPSRQRPTDNPPVVTKVAYDQREYAEPDTCLAGIRERLALGWDIVQLRGPGNGPFVVLFRKSDTRDGSAIRKPSW